MSIKSPPLSSDNPVFQHGRRDEPPPAAGRKMSWVLAGVSVFTIAVMIAVFIANIRYGLLLSSPIAISTLIVGTFFLGADMYYMAIAVTSINREMENGQWDLLKLTTMHERDIIQGKYAAAVQRAKRVVMAVQLVCLCAFVLDNLPVILPQSLNQIFSINGMDYPGYLSVYLAGIVVAAPLQVYWRSIWMMRYVVAVSVAVSATFRRVWSAPFVGAAIIPIAHLAAFLGTLYLSALLGQTLFYSLGGANVFLRAFLSAGLGGIVEYIVYWLLTAGALRLATRNAFKPQ